MTIRRLIIEFTKMNGAGNDFLVIDNRFYHFTQDELSQIARTQCTRRTGIGADGLLALDTARDPGAHFRMKYLNADGSVGSMCGNGARCIARYARGAGFADEPLAIETDAGVYTASVQQGEGAPVKLFLPAHRDYRLCKLPGEAQQIHYIWTGTEHAVTFASDLGTGLVESMGPSIRADKRVSVSGANVNFVRLVAGDRLQVRTYEKGVEAETLACGTGAVASALVSRITGRQNADRIFVEMSGGTLVVGMREGSVAGRPEADYLEGPAEVVFRGTFSF